MTVAWSLLAYGTVLAVAGPRLLAALPAARRAPRLGAVVWQLAAGSAVLSWVLAGVTMAAPVPALDSLGHMLTWCLSTLHDAAIQPRERGAEFAGLLISMTVAGRAGGCLLAGAVSRHRWRNRHARMLKIVARPAPELNAVILEHPVPMAYCLPSRRQTVVTRGALEALSAEELAAVLTHEQAHLRARHDLALAPVQALARAFPGVPLLTAAARELPILLEMCADDAAARRHGPSPVVGALRSLSSRHTPEGTLAAGGSSAAARIERLLQPRRRSLLVRAVFGAAVLLLAAGPILVTLGPALLAAVASLGYCPVPPVT